MKEDDFKWALSKASKSLFREYVCKADGYTVTYDPLEGLATYHFPNNKIILENLIESTVASLVKTGYWYEKLYINKEGLK